MASRLCRPEKWHATCDCCQKCRLARVQDQGPRTRSEGPPLVSWLVDSWRHLYPTITTMLTQTHSGPSRTWPSLEFSKVCKTNAVEPWSESGERKPPLTMLYLFPTSWVEITLKLFCHIPSISSGKLPWARFQPVDCPFSRLFLGPKDRSFSYPF